MILKNKERVSRTLLTLYGKITYKRTLLVPNDSESSNQLIKLQNANSVCPLDSFLEVDGLPFKMTVKMMCAIAKEAVRATSYERAAKIITEHYNTQMSSATVRNVTDAVGLIVYADDIDRAEKAAAVFDEKIDLRKKHKSKSDILYLEMDGAMFNTRKVEKDSSWMECKIGIGFLSSDLKSWTTKKGERRRQITKKRLTGYIGNYKTFKNHILALAESYQYKYRNQIVVISDGADWIHTLTKELFPEAVHILDLSHVKEHVGDYCLWLFDEDKAHEWIETINRLIEESEIDQVLTKLNPYKDLACPKGISNLYTYISNHRTCMDYKHYRECGYFVGSGASESANKYAMQNRMKLQGMRWNKDTGQHMLSLKTRLESDCWFEVETLVKKYYKKELSDAK